MQPAIKQKLIELQATLPAFPDGRIDYTHAAEAVALHIIIIHKGKVLLLKRSDQVHSLKNRWHVMGGFMDEIVSIEEKVREEIREELSVDESCIGNIHVYDMHVADDDGVRWFLIPVVVQFDSVPEITLDWEHTEYAWVDPSQIARYDLVTELYESLQEILGL